MIESPPMPSDYYEPHATMLLAQPLVLAGQIGAGVARVARAISGRTGLPFVEIDRQVEARAGASLFRIVEREGDEGLRIRSEAALAQSLAQRPCSLVVLGSATLDAERLGAACSEARLLYVRRPIEQVRIGIAARLAAEANPDATPDANRETTPETTPEANYARTYPYVHGVPTLEALEPIFRAREEALRGADAIVEAGDRHAHVVAAELLAALDRFIGVSGCEPPE